MDTTTKFSIGILVVSLLILTYTFRKYLSQTMFNSLPTFIETCKSFPNEGVYVPAAYYDIKYRPSNYVPNGLKVKSEDICAQKALDISEVGAYMYNNGTCYLINKDNIKSAKYYCKSGTGISLIPSFAPGYQKKIARPILGHGYVIEGRIGGPTSAISESSETIEKCLTLPEESAKKVWEDKSYKIPELDGLDMNNYEELVDCKSYCTSLGGYQYPWCYTKDDKTGWGFCTHGCTGFDCFEGQQAWNLPPLMSQSPTCNSPACIQKDEVEKRCGNCNYCAGGSTCAEVAPENLSPSARSNYYCLYPGSGTDTKCCTERNMCHSIIDAPSTWTSNLQEVAVSKPYLNIEKEKKISTPGTEIGYNYVSDDKIINTCIAEARCDLPVNSPDATWCADPNYIPNTVSFSIKNNPLGECANPSPNTRCCTFYTDSPASASPNINYDSYVSKQTAELGPQNEVARTCRTKCTTLNPTDPPNPLQHSWCITDPNFPTTTLAGKPISFPIVNKDLNPNRSFWNWGFCDENVCNNKLAKSTISNSTINKYPEITGE